MLHLIDYCFMLFSK